MFLVSTVPAAEDITTSPDPSNKLSGGAIVGICLGVIVVALPSIYGIYYYVFQMQSPPPGKPGAVELGETKGTEEVPTGQGGEESGTGTTQDGFVEELGEAKGTGEIAVVPTGVGGEEPGTGITQDGSVEANSSAATDEVPLAHSEEPDGKKEEKKEEFKEDGTTSENKNEEDGQVNEGFSEDSVL